MRSSLAALVAAAALAAASCAGDEEVRTVTVPAGDPPGLERFAYAEVERLARRTCAAIPRGVLARSLDAVSSDRDIPRERPFSDNDIALLYAEDVRIQRIRLQQAAYDGCSAGLRDQRR